MTQTSILWPLCALAALTLIVLLCIPHQRFRAARNYMNLLEIPLLFYIACLTLFAARRVDPVMVTLAWIYVALRATHSLVHLTYDNVFHRLSLFAASNGVLVVLWIRLVRVLYTL